ncbi:DUF1073 domain-containing protein [Achromobacter xylosoxidans]|uniref:DUF1073 domain-containing protein n=1 Tax=Alcaligenes xylosoxydans xylosoxydans TaxID=85698 RepID=UPI001EEC210D|nr:DUF1073 domain-containing protein [Achromobacter xylosoxidans]
MIVAKDGRALRDPLNLDALDTLLELKVFTLDDVSATERRYSNLKEANYGMPEIYRVRVQAAGGAFGRVSGA